MALNRFGVYFIGFGYNVAIWGRYGVTEGMIYWLICRLIGHGWECSIVYTPVYLHFISNVISQKNGYLFYFHIDLNFWLTENTYTEGRGVRFHLKHIST